MHKYIFEMKQTFDGHFPSDCQIDSVPQSLLSLISMIIGSSVSDNDTAIKHDANVAAISIAQLISFNSVCERKHSTHLRRNSDKETLLPIYNGLLLHSHTRSKKLIEAFHNRGLSVSYDRVLAISTALGNSVCEQFTSEGIVCPPILRKGVFTTACVDNIDHNPSSRTAKESFHGTAISITQHLENSKDGIKRPTTAIDSSSNKYRSLRQLPASYTTVHPFVLK